MKLTLSEYWDRARMVKRLGVLHSDDLDNKEARMIAYGGCGIDDTELKRLDADAASVEKIRRQHAAA